MATAPVDDRKRVKVYELKNNDWYDRGTGFCAGEIVGIVEGNPDFPDARLVVHSEEEPTSKLLETRITKEDGYQQQQQTLIVWTESNGVDMALSFQEAEGCATIWRFVSDIQNKLSALAPDGGLSDDEMLDPISQIITLPKPRLGHLEEVLATIRNASSTQQGRETLAKIVTSSENLYIRQLAPLVEEAEDLESTQDLHHLCTIMKHLILLNDNQIIEYVVKDEAIDGVLGALEYDPDFPSHRGAHRQFLRETSKFKEIVEFTNPDVRNKIHYTHRLLYLKDVVLARILDDPTFSVLNSLIFFHHVDIIRHITEDVEHCERLFAIFSDEDKDSSKRKEAVLFVQNCCAVAKNIQPSNRSLLYNTFVKHGLFPVIGFALRHHDASVRVAGTDILVSLIDHDAAVVRAQIQNNFSEQDGPLFDTLMELLLVEVDLGVKVQMADAIKILLDPSSTHPHFDPVHRMSLVMKSTYDKSDPHGRGITPHQAEQNRVISVLIKEFYTHGARRLFQPLLDLEQRNDLRRLGVQELSLFTHLVDILCFFVRQHAAHIRTFVDQEHLHVRISRLLQCRQKHMRLVALKWFRTCIGLQDEFHNTHIVENRLLDPILDIVYETMPRDNLLNSACLELFEYIRRENIKTLVDYLGSVHRDRLLSIPSVSIFRNLVLRHDQNIAPPMPVAAEADHSFTTEADTPPPGGSRAHTSNSRQLFSGLREDPIEDAYFNSDDGLEEELPEDEEFDLPAASPKTRLTNGHLASSKVPLVDYPDDDDDDDDDGELLASSPDILSKRKKGSDSSSSNALDSGELVDEEPRRGRTRTPKPAGDFTGPKPASSESLNTIKRRRDDDDEEEDELGRLMSVAKRRNSSASLSSRSHVAEKPAQFDVVEATSSDAGEDELTHSPINPADSPTQDNVSAVTGHGHTLRRKGSMKTRNESATINGKFSVKLNAANHRSPPLPDQQDEQRQTQGKSSNEERLEHCQG